MEKTPQLHDDTGYCREDFAQEAIISGVLKRIVSSTFTDGNSSAHYGQNRSWLQSAHTGGYFRRQISIHWRARRLMSGWPARNIRNSSAQYGAFVNPCAGNVVIQRSKQGTSCRQAGDTTHLAATRNG
jgi:hypothetical protein